MASLISTRPFLHCPCWTIVVARITRSLADRPGTGWLSSARTAVPAAPISASVRPSTMPLILSLMDALLRQGAGCAALAVLPVEFPDDVIRQVQGVFGVNDDLDRGVAALVHHHREPALFGDGLGGRRDLLHVIIHQLFLFGAQLLVELLGPLLKILELGAELIALLPLHGLAHCAFLVLELLFEVLELLFVIREKLLASRGVFLERVQRAASCLGFLQDRLRVHDPDLDRVGGRRVPHERDLDEDRCGNRDSCPRESPTHSSGLLSGWTARSPWCESAFWGRGRIAVSA